MTATPAAQKLIREDDFDAYDLIPATKDGDLLHEFDAASGYADEHGTEHVWTVLDCDGDLYASPGFHAVNRIGYVLSRKPWTDPNMEAEYAVSGPE